MSITLTLPSHLGEKDQLVAVKKDEYRAFKKWLAEMDSATEAVRIGEKEIKEGKIKFTKKSIAEALHHKV